MANERMEQLLGGLSPELQEKMKGCSSVDELLKLADENDIEIPSDALEEVAGGCGDKACSSCGSGELTYVKQEYVGNTYYSVYKCCKCGAETYF